MPQIFHPSTNTISRVSVFGAVLLVACAIGVAGIVVRSPYTTEVGVVRSQPVPFSHQHHTGEIGIDCRFCHRTVATEASAGMPATEVCLACHSELWNDSEMLSPVRESWKREQPLAWVRVHDLPDFVYFHHGIHVTAGIACETCHGRMDRMPLTWRNATLHMEWCLDCHRHPEREVRPASAVFEMGWEPQKPASSAADAVEEHRIYGETHCSACHR